MRAEWIFCVFFLRISIYTTSFTIAKKLRMRWCQGQMLTAWINWRWVSALNDTEHVLLIPEISCSMYMYTLCTYMYFIWNIQEKVKNLWLKNSVHTCIYPHLWLPVCYIRCKIHVYLNIYRISFFILCISLSSRKKTHKGKHYP